MELVTCKNFQPFENGSILGIYGDLLDIEEMGLNIRGITYNDEWKVTKFLKYHKNKKKLEVLFKDLNIKEDILNIKIKNLKNYDFKMVLLSYMLINDYKYFIFDYFDTGLIYQEKKRLINIISSLKKEGKEIMIISNDLIFMNQIVDVLKVIKNKEIVYEGNVLGVLNMDFIEKPEIVKFICYANKKGAGLDMELGSNELLKNIYRSLS